MAVYERHRPESTVLYQSVARAWPKIEMDYAVTDQSISPHVTAEFERYKRCGILEHGFVRLYCKECDAERVIGFSCKGRGFCPACGSRRAFQKADRLEREVWPRARVRQFVLTFPHQIRRWLLASPELFNEVIRVVVGEISRFYVTYSHQTFGKRGHYMPTTGSVTFIQLFGSSLGANPHMHMMFLEGVYVSSRGGPRFYEQPAFDTATVMTILGMIYKRLTRLFAKKGYVDTSGEASVPEDIDSDVPMPFRPRAPKAYRRKGRLLANPLYQHPDPDVMSVQGWCNVRYRWFSLHAAVKIEGTDLITRPAVQDSETRHNVGVTLCRRT